MALHVQNCLILNIKIRKKTPAGHTERAGDKQNARGGGMCGHEEERPLSKHGRRCDDNIKIDLEEIFFWAWPELL